MATTYYLINNSSDLSGGADFNLILDETTFTVETITVSVANLATETSYGFTQSNEPGNATQDNNNWSVIVDISTGTTDIKLSIQLRRISSTGTVLASSSVTSEQDATAGIKTFNITWDGSTWASTNRMRCDFIFRSIKEHGGAAEVQIDCNDTSTYVSSPLTPAFIDAAIALTASATTAMVAAAQKNASLALTATANSVIAAAVTANASLAMTSTATIAPAAEITANAAIAMTATADIAMDGMVAKDAELSLTASATMTSTAEVTRNFALSMTASANMATDAAVQANAALALTADADVVVAAAIQAGAAIALSASADIASAAEAQINAALAMTATADMTAAAAIQANAIIAMTATANMAADAAVTRNFALAMTATADFSATAGTGTVDAAMALTASATMSSAAAAQMNAAISLTATATAVIAAAITADAALAMTATADIVVSAAIQADAALAMTATADFTGTAEVPVAGSSGSGASAVGFRGPRLPRDHIRLRRFNRRTIWGLSLSEVVIVDSAIYDMSPSNDVFICDTDSLGGIDINLVKNVQSIRGKMVAIKNTGMADSVDVNPAAGDSIDSTTILTIGAGASALIVAAGDGNWWVIHP